MKRVIREVITMIRIERWLVKTDTSTTAELSTFAQEEASFPSGDAAESLIETEATVVVEEHIVEPSATAEDQRVISQRVIDVQQWEVKHDKMTK